MSWVSSDLHANSYSVPSTRLSSLRERLRYSGAIHSSRSALSRGDSAHDEVIVDVGPNQRATYIELLLARMEQHGLRRCGAADEDLSSYTVAPFAERDDEATSNNNINNNDNDNFSTEIEREPYYYICVPCEMRLTRVARCAASLRMLDDVHYHFASAVHRQNARWMADPDIDRTLHTSSLLSTPFNSWTRIYVNGLAVLLSRRPGGGEMFYPLPHEEHRIARPDEPSTHTAATRLTCSNNINVRVCTMNDDNNKEDSCESNECKQQTRCNKRQRLEECHYLSEEKYAINKRVMTMQDNMATAHLSLFPEQSSMTYWFAPIYSLFTQCKQLIVPFDTHNKCAGGEILSQHNIIDNSKAESYSPCYGQYAVQHIPQDTYVQNTKLPASYVPLYPVLLRLEHCKVRKSDVYKEESTMEEKHAFEPKESETKHVNNNENLQEKWYDANMDKCEMDSHATYDANDNRKDDDNAWCSVYVQRSNSPLLQWTTADQFGKGKTNNANINTKIPFECNEKQNSRREEEYARLERCEVEHDGVYRLCLFSKAELKRLAAWQFQTCESQQGQVSSIDNKINTTESHTHFVTASVTSTTTTTTQSIHHTNKVESMSVNDTIQTSVLTKELLDTIPLYLPYQAYHAANSIDSSYLNSVSNSNKSSNSSDDDGNDDAEQDKESQSSKMKGNLTSNHVSKSQSVSGDCSNIKNKNTNDGKADSHNSHSYPSSYSSISSEEQRE